MLSAHQKMQIAAWKAETESARERVHGENAPEWITKAAFFFFCERETDLEEAERKGRFIDAQVAHRHTLRALCEVDRAAVLGKSIDAYFERARAA